MNADPHPTVWSFAMANGRDYITPEDVDAAIAGGAERAAVQQEVLEALGRRACEDWSACAFVAALREVSR